MSQINDIYNILDDGLPHRTDEMQEKIFGTQKVGLWRCAARINDLRKKGLIIRGWHDEQNPSLYWYQLIKLNFNGVAIDEQNRTYTPASMQS